MCYRILFILCLFTIVGCTSNKSEELVQDEVVDTKIYYNIENIIIYPDYASAIAVDKDEVIILKTEKYTKYRILIDKTNIKPYWIERNYKYHYKLQPSLSHSRKEIIININTLDDIKRIP